MTEREIWKAFREQSAEIAALRYLVRHMLGTMSAEARKFAFAELEDVHEHLTKPAMMESDEATRIANHLRYLIDEEESTASSNFAKFSAQISR